MNFQLFFIACAELLNPDSWISIDLNLNAISIGTWSLHVDELGVATVVKTSGDADICVGVAELTSMWTGALSATQLRDYDLLYSRDETCAFRIQYSSRVEST